MQPTIVENLIPQSVGDWTPARGGNAIRYIVLHTTDSSKQSAIDTFMSGARKASAHRIVGLDGSITVTVSDGNTAWHADNWPVNEQSLGLEHEDNANPSDASRTDAEYASSSWQISEWCRQYGILCGLIDVDPSTKMPTAPSGILIHSQVSEDGTDCPDGYDYDRAVEGAQALLGGAVPAPVDVAAAPGVTPWSGSVKVTVQTLKVHAALPVTSEDAGNFANTPDGMVHSGNLVTITGYAYGLQVGDSAVWLHDQFGRYLFAEDTDFFEAAPSVPKLAPTPPPSYDFVAQAGNVTITSPIGANIRTEPTTAASIAEAKDAGIVISTTGYVSNGESVNGDTKWWKVGDNYVSNAVVSFGAPAPAAPVSVPVQPSPPVAPAASVAQSTTPPPAGLGAVDSVKAPAPATPAPTPPAQGASPMSIRDYLVAFVAWVMKPFL